MRGLLLNSSGTEQMQWREWDGGLFGSGDNRSNQATQMVELRLLALGDDGQLARILALSSEKMGVRSKWLWLGPGCVHFAGEGWR